MKKLLLILLFLFSLCVSAQLAPPLSTPLNRAHPLSQGLIGCWFLNEGGGQIAFDNNGQLNNGTLTSGAFYSVKQRGQCVSFDGTNDYIQIGDKATFDKTFTNFSVFMWISPNILAGTVVAGKMDGAGNRGWMLLINANGSIYLDIFQTAAGTEFETTTATGLITTDKWYHVGFTFQGSVNARVYVNGLIVTENTTSPTTQLNGSNSAPLRIGERGDGSAYFNGYIKDVKISNRTLLQNEVQQLYINSFQSSQQ